MDGMCGIEYHFLCERLDFPIKKEKHRWLVIRRFSCFCGFNASDAVSDGLKLGQRRGLVCFQSKYTALVFFVLLLLINGAAL